MKLIGLTGGMGSGKSTISNYLRAKGVAVFDADAAAKRAVEVGSPCLQEISRLFGSSYITKDGTLDREKTAALVFGNTEARQQLESVLHSRIWQMSEEFVARHCAEILVVLDVPLLIECGWYKKVDEVWLVVIEEAEQLRRTILRDSSNEAAVRARLAAQMPIQEKKAYASVIFDNNGSVESLLKQVDTVLREELLQRRD